MKAVHKIRRSRSGDTILNFNITDNDSAKMKTSKRFIQGYNGLAMVDSKHQVVVGAEAFGKGPEHELLNPLKTALSVKKKKRQMQMQSNIIEAIGSI